MFAKKKRAQRESATIAAVRVVDAVIFRYLGFEISFLR